MIKFKILNYAVLLIASICILAATLFGIMLFIDYSNPEILLPITMVFIKILLLAISLSFIKQTCGMFLRHGYFNNKSARYLTIGGYTLAASALTTLIPNMFYISDITSERASYFVIEIIYDITVLLVGFALLAVADIIKKGTAMKLENDLTI